MFSNFPVSVPLYILKNYCGLQRGFCLYRLGPRIFTLLEIEIEPLSEHKHIQARVPWAVRVMAPDLPCGLWKPALHRHGRLWAIRAQRALVLPWMELNLSCPSARVSAIPTRAQITLWEDLEYSWPLNSRSVNYSHLLICRVFSINTA